MLDDRVERLLAKAEQATDRNDLDQAETYRVLAGHAAYLSRREARDLNRTFAFRTGAFDE
ncbi:hypothetical protein AB0230_01900 [Microbacterium sp. NPDC089190]|uniref:hypothetical protein n=1 Tax=Microbacterium sp. NPDC089190 TaxID=3155063 RepID=UPI00344BA1EE